MRLLKQLTHKQRLMTDRPLTVDIFVITFTSTYHSRYRVPTNTAKYIHAKRKSGFLCQFLESGSVLHNNILKHSSTFPALFFLS